jgi:hypothetical protein
VKVDLIKYDLPNILTINSINLVKI